MFTHDASYQASLSVNRLDAQKVDCSFSHVFLSPSRLSALTR